MRQCKSHPYVYFCTDGIPGRPRLYSEMRWTKRWSPPRGKLSVRRRCKVAENSHASHRSLVTLPDDGATRHLCVAPCDHPTQTEVMTLRAGVAIEGRSARMAAPSESFPRLNRLRDCTRSERIDDSKRRMFCFAKTTAAGENNAYRRV
jgi:hypothetical protein